MSRGQIMSFVLVALVWAIPGQAEAKATKPKYSVYQVFDKMMQVQDDQAVLICDIKRTEIKNFGSQAGQPQTVSGTLKVRSGGYARLELTHPARQLMVSNGKKLWMELPEVQQVYRMSTKQLKKSGNFFLDLAGTVRYYSKNALKRLIPPGKSFDKKTVQAIELLPDDPEKTGFRVMKVWVDVKRWVILRVVLKASGVDVGVSFNNIVTYTHKQVKKNKKLQLSKKLFGYKPPKDFDLFDLDF